MRITQYKTIQNANRKIQLVKEKSCNYVGMETLSNPAAIHRMLCDVFQHDKQTEEYIYIICVNTAMKPTGIFEISHGTVNQSLCSPREIFQKALLCNATGIILAHNHPSGSVIPSNTDIDMYNRMKKACDLMNIPLYDNIIVGDSYYSFLENKIS